jgi:carbon monoxide dehydrogenase subunit G
MQDGGEGMLIEEKFTVNAPREKVWAFLMDPKSLAPCVPGCEKVKAVDDRTFLATVKVKIAFVSLAFNMKVQITEMSPPAHLETSAAGEESSMTSNIKARSVLDLTSLPDGGTEVSYRSEVSLFGKLGTMGQSVVKGKAKQVGKEFAEAVKKRLESKP